MGPPASWLQLLLAGACSIGLVSGCSFEPSGFAASGRDGGANDDGGDFDADLPVGPDGGCMPVLGFSPSNFEECDVSPVGGPVTLDQTDDEYLLDTSAGTLTDPLGTVITLPAHVVSQDGGPELLVWAVEQLDIDPGVRVVTTGQRALVIMAITTISIDGVLSVGARGSQSGPAGDRDSDCDEGRGANGVSQTVEGNTGGSGGGGGGFAEPGGTGAPIPGLEDSDSTMAGSAAAQLSLVPLRGGCAGGTGGVVADSGGQGGGAGGAVQLVAGAGIAISGVVSARGGGGGLVQGPFGGGGGGGSGGGILIETHSLTIHGAVTANGGGGGEGGRTSGVSDSGSDGHDADGLRAAGGFGLSFGGNGGRGGAIGEPGGEDGAQGISTDEAAAGGGGGGGSVGVIRLRAPGGIERGVFSVISPAPAIAD